MPPQPQPLKPNKFYFFHGHRRPSQNRPVVYGGLFSNRKTINPKQNPKTHPPSSQLETFDLQKWDPDLPKALAAPPTNTPSEHFFNVVKTLTPIARFICDSFRKHKTWGPPIMEDLSKLRRVTPNLVAEVLKVQTDPRVSSKFFHWAGKQKGYRHNFASYNAFAYCLNRNNQFRAADQLPELMQMQGKPPSEKQFEILIRMHADANRGLRVYFIYEKMRKFGVKPRVFLYNRIMDALVKTDHLDLAMAVYEDFKEEGLVEESVTFMILTKGLCKAGRIDDVVEFLGRMKENLCTPDIFAYTALVKLLVSEGNFDGCLRIWEEMLTNNVKPDVMAYTTLVKGLCAGNRVEKAYDMFKEMKEKRYLIDRVIYGLLVKAFVDNGKVGSACDLLKDLIDSGYRADLSIYNSLIQGLCSVSRVDKAYKLFLLTVQEGLQPDLETANPMLVSYAEQQRMDDFCKLLSQMEKLGLSITEELPKFFVFILRNEEKIMTALDVLGVLREKGHCSIPIYNILMGALYDVGDVDKVLSLYHEIKASNLNPDESTYSIIIPCFVEVGDLDQACMCYNKIIEMSCVPSVSAYYALAKGLCRSAKIDALIFLVRDCLANVPSGPMEFKYTLTILHASRSNDAEKVIKVIDEMMQEGSFPDDIICCAVICGMCQHGTLEEARKVFSTMRDRNLLSEANTIMYDEMLIDYMKKKTAGLVLAGLKFFQLESKLKAKGSTLLPS